MKASVLIPEGKKMDDKDDAFDPSFCHRYFAFSRPPRANRSLKTQLPLPPALLRPRRAHSGR
jgi:hypothetical protein